VGRVQFPVGSRKGQSSSQDEAEKDSHTSSRREQCGLLDWLLQIQKGQQGVQSLSSGNGLGWQGVKQSGGVMDGLLKVENARQYSVLTNRDQYVT